MSNLTNPATNHQMLKTMVLTLPESSHSHKYLKFGEWTRVGWVTDSKTKQQKQIPLWPHLAGEPDKHAQKGHLLGITAEEGWCVRLSSIHWWKVTVWGRQYQLGCSQAQLMPLTIKLTVDLKASPLGSCLNHGKTVVLRAGFWPTPTTFYALSGHWKSFRGSSVIFSTLATKPCF